MATNKVKQKSFNVKVYNLAGTFLRSINPLDIMTGIAFTSQINGGQGELRLKIRAGLSSSILAYNNVIRVYETDDVVQTPRLIYSGIIWSLNRLSDGIGDYIEIRSVGLSSMLSWVYFQSGGNYIFTKAQELATSVQNVASSFNSQYSGLITFSAGTSIENTGITGTTLSFSYDKCNAALKKITDTGTHWWYIGADGVLHYHPKTGAIGQITHKLTFGEDIDSITVDENVEQMANRFMVKWSGGTVTVNDATSQTANGIREAYEDKASEITDSTTATTRANSQLAKNKDVRRKVSVVVNDNYDIETMRPGDLVTIRNSDYDITALQINKIEYNTDNIKVELEDINSFTSELYL